MTKWKDITSAPKDGTEILAHDQKTGTSRVTYWSNFGWHDPDGHYYSAVSVFTPTHWMELPSPPKSRRGNEDE